MREFGCQPRHGLESLCFDVQDPCSNSVVACVVNSAERSRECLLSYLLLESACNLVLNEVTVNCRLAAKLCLYTAAVQGAICKGLVTVPCRPEAAAVDPHAARDVIVTKLPGNQGLLTAKVHG